jgi:type 1 glutamine amidotransferase
MNGRGFFFIKTILFLLAFAIIIGCVNHKKEDLIDVLVLSGKNNHEWQKTTPILAKVFKDARIFTISITEKPDTLTYNELIKYDVVLSNWNSWPDNDFRMTKEWENDFLKYVKGGGGVVFIHAGASSFYSWNEYHQMGIGRWGKYTNHGKQTKGKIYGFNQTHPITEGFRDFFIVDEMWEKTDIYPGVKAVAFVTATDEKDGHLISEPAVFVNHIGKGRSFFTILGHNERALLNSGLQTILLRAVQWCAGKDVTIELPPGLIKPESRESDQFSWNETDTSLTFRNHSEIVWQFNYNNRFGNVYFHPLNVNHTVLTCFSPSDHPWHLGLWFSWKFINGVNYWEYLDDFKSEETGYKSEGITELQKIDILKNPDFSTSIRMEFQYHPADSGLIMTEQRNIMISQPFNDGSYYIDQESVFNPLVEEVVLDRTPVEGEPEGKSWGGYAGLSVRFNQDYTSPEIIAASGSENYKKDNYLYMGFNTLTGEKAGICIFQNLKFTTQTTSWYVIKDEETPFYYFSPAVLYDGRIILKKCESLHLKYRVLILPGITGKDEIQAKYDEYLNNFSQHNQEPLN